MNEPLFIGYFPRRIGPIPPGPQVPPQVVQLCNAGHCDGLVPKGWQDLWRHNEMWLFDSEALAWSVVSEAEWAGYEIHAYRIFPSVFVEAIEHPVALPPVKPEPMTDNYDLVGFDPVSCIGLGPNGQSWAKCFGHSSLSPFCNGRCEDISVNRYCLLETAEHGLIKAREFSAGGGEPEPYVLVEVWRRRGCSATRLTPEQ